MTTGQNPYQWAQENLSKPRARAFWEAYRNLERVSLSAEYYAEHRKADAIKDAKIRELLPQIDAVLNEANKSISEIDEQINALRQKQQEIRDTSQAEVDKIYSVVWNDPDYLAQGDKARQIHRADRARLDTLTEALKEKYLKAQEKASA
jgi:RNA processing factor Prp31